MLATCTATCAGQSYDGWREVVQPDEHTKQELKQEATQDKACMTLMKGMHSMTK